MNVRLTIDGTGLAAREGAGLLDVIRRCGIDVPSLCHHEAVVPAASCRLCLVEVLRSGRSDWQLTTSCDYPVLPGLEVVTRSPRIERHRRMNLQLLLPYASGSPVLTGLATKLGIERPLFPPVEDATLKDCILCELCVRICSSLGHNALSVIGRGDHKRIGPPFGEEAARACVGCGACSLACPTQCIPIEESETTRTIWGHTLESTTCRRCGARMMTTSERSVLAARSRSMPGISVDVCESCRRDAVAKQLAFG